MTHLSRNGRLRDRMPVLTRFKLDGGTNQTAARKLLPPEGLLRRVVNLELRRDSELGVRPGFTALGAMSKDARFASCMGFGC